MTFQPLRALHFGLASFLFFLSGATGLAYQVIWFKRFSHVWGNSTLAMAAVIASFLTGLGLGASLIGRFADRTRAPLFWYGISEAAIGGLAICVPFAIQLLLYVASAIYPHLESGPFVHSVARFGLTFLVLVLPCLLMGGTLPLLVKHFVRPGGAPRESTGWLYAINTLGAAAGCYAAGFHVLPTFGLHTTNAMVAALNLAIGLAAQALWGWGRSDPAAPAVGGDPRTGDDAGSLAPGSELAEHPAAEALAPPGRRQLLAGCLALALIGWAGLIVSVILLPQERVTSMLHLVTAAAASLLAGMGFAGLQAQRMPATHALAALMAISVMVAAAALGTWPSAW